MYSAIADQLYLLGLTKQPSYQITRHAASTYLLENPDSFMPFVPSIMGEDMAGAVEEGGSEKVYAEYCKRVEQSGDWGGEIEVSPTHTVYIGRELRTEPKILVRLQIQALSRYYNVPIHVIQRGPPFIISHAPGEAGNGTLSSEESLKQGNVVRISYHRRMYGLGEVSRLARTLVNTDGHLLISRLVLCHFAYIALQLAASCS
jgi:OTU domain-containing protein 6